jgi:tetratricopeptide (TPR) repeat protein
VLLALLSLGVGNGASAQETSDEDLQRAVELFEESEVLYNRGEFQEAAELIVRAYSLSPDPVLLFNLGRALESAGDLDGAIDAYARYLEAAPDATDRGAIEQRLRTLRDQQARLAEAGEAHEGGDENADGETVVGGGGASPLPFVIAGAGVAVVALGIVFGVTSQGKHDDAVAARTQHDAHELQSDAETFATLANVSLVLGGAMLIGGGVWAVLELTGGDDESDEGATLSVQPTGVLLSGRF